MESALLAVETTAAAARNAESPEGRDVESLAGLARQRAGASANPSRVLDILIGDLLELYSKTKHRQQDASVLGLPDVQSLLGEQSAEIVETVNAATDCVRSMEGLTLRSMGRSARTQSIRVAGRRRVAPLRMLAELRNDNLHVVVRMQEMRDWFEERGDVDSTHMLERWIEEAERRVWFLFEADRVWQVADRLR
jgi:starvation-inducible DNA-binding protein